MDVPYVSSAFSLQIYQSHLRCLQPATYTLNLQLLCVHLLFHTCVYIVHRRSEKFQLDDVRSFRCERALNRMQRRSETFVRTVPSESTNERTMKRTERAEDRRPLWPTPRKLDDVAVKTSTVQRALMILVNEITRRRRDSSQHLPSVTLDLSRARATLLYGCCRVYGGRRRFPLSHSCLAASSYLPTLLSTCRDASATTQPTTEGEGNRDEKWTSRRSLEVEGQADGAGSTGKRQARNTETSTPAET